MTQTQEAKPMRPLWHEGVPTCSGTECPYGKYDPEYSPHFACALGSEALTVCEPAVRAMHDTHDELVAALEKIATQPDYTNPEEMVRTAREAIAKATHDDE